MSTSAMPLKHFLETVQDGDEHGWSTEIAFLRHAHAEQIDELLADIKQNGIHTPIQIGPDGRCWDGHHRIACAVILDLHSIPVEHVRQESA